MGGADIGNYSALALRACRDEAGYRGPIEIVTTRSNPNLDDLTALAAKYSNTRLSLDLPDLALFYGSHDLQIGAGGGAVLERACIGVPSLTLICAENQLLAVPFLIDLGAGAMVAQPADWRDITAQDVGRVLKVLIADAGVREQLAVRSRSLVDGQGASRVASFLLKQHLKASA
jgi:spore coat polysaccharide biosynthesis predicted glycosyltransferase SpsG